MLSCLVPFVFFLKNGRQADTVTVTVDNMPVCEYSLNENIRDEIVTEYGKNIIEIRDGKVCVTDSDCPDGYCKNYGWISVYGQSIICLPHKMMITISKDSEDSEDIDAYVQ